MSDIPPGRQAAFRSAILRFLQERLDDKLDRLADDDPKREALTSQFQFQAWLDDAARRVTQIQAVTHSLKPIHPDARGTNLYCPPSVLHARAEVGSHCLDQHFADDIVGNAAALDVHKFLKLEVEGKSLLVWMQEGNDELAAAISPDVTQAEVWINAFVGITRARGGAASHGCAKQVYWLTGHDPRTDGQYHLLAPLYASSLAHAAYQRINSDRFGEPGKEARQARRDNREHATGFSEYPSLAVQKLGGTKPQNISQLNSERRGNNYLLSSLPPSWKSRSVHPPWQTDSIFTRQFGARDEVRGLVRGLRKFLVSKPPTNVHTRSRVERALDGLIGELVMFAAALQTGLPAGWSQDTECDLAEAERLWLDPDRAVHDELFYQQWQSMHWPEEIGNRFGNWLNMQLGSGLPVGDSEQRQWRRELLADDGESGWAWHLRQQREQITAATRNAQPGEAP